MVTMVTKTFLYQGTPKNPRELEGTPHILVGGGAPFLS